MSHTPSRNFETEEKRAVVLLTTLWLLLLCSTLLLAHGVLAHFDLVPPASMLGIGSARQSPGTMNPTAGLLFAELAIVIACATTIWGSAPASNSHIVRWLVRLAGTGALALALVECRQPTIDYLRVAAHSSFAAFALLSECLKRESLPRWQPAVYFAALGAVVFSVLSVVEAERRPDVESGYGPTNVNVTGAADNSNEQQGRVPTLTNRQTTDAVDFTVRIVDPADGSTGSGAVVAQQAGFAYILTAAHVVNGSDDLEVHFFSKRSGSSVGSFPIVKELAQDAPNDVALVRVLTGEDLRVTAPAIAAIEPPAGEEFPVTAFGCRGSQPPTATETVARSAVIRESSEAHPRFVWEIDQSVEYGQSGGALLDAQSNLIGIASGISGGKAYFCHITPIKNLLKMPEYAWILENTEAHR